jgi:hypothetical protein
MLSVALSVDGAPGLGSGASAGWLLAALALPSMGRRGRGGAAILGAPSCHALHHQAFVPRLLPSAIG